MITRCYYSKSESYKHVRVWRCFLGPNGFRTWLEWMGPVPFRGATVNRIDNGGHYVPGNMEWASKRKQALERGLFRNNRSGYRGVRLDRGRWRAEIRVEGKVIHLGYYKVREQAARIWNECALLFNGSSAQLNEVNVVRKRGC